MNVVEDTLNHIKDVKKLLKHFSDDVLNRGALHDSSKLVSPEKEMFEEWRPKLDKMDVDSQEYKDALKQMLGIALEHHYAENAHHPEHWIHGIRDMTLVDVAEMVCDWIAAAHKRGQAVNIKWASERFGIKEGEMLYSVIENTIKKYEDVLK